MSNLLAAPSPALVACGALIALCCIAAWTDLWFRRVTNWLCAVTALAGLVSAFLVDGELSGVASNALHMVAALVAGMVLFQSAVIGGGDAKFYAAVAAWFSLSKSMTLLLMVSMSGLVLFVLWFGYRRIRRIPIRKSPRTAFDSLPYGIAIGSGAIATMFVRG